MTQELGTSSWVEGKGTLQTCWAPDKHTACI